MSESYIVIAIDRDRTCLKRFQCGRCLLPERILTVDELRTVVMRRRYPDYAHNTVEYDRRVRTGEIAPELENYIRTLLRDGEVLRALSTDDLDNGIFIY